MTESVTRLRNTVNGEARDAAEWIASQNPFTGEVWAEVPRCTPAQTSPEWFHYYGDLADTAHEAARHPADAS
jgi:acyl-CoA reductase-like NAD-dependent aldehyde dehydrogenase